MEKMPLNVRVDRIGQHIVRARLFLDLWFYFEEEESRRKIIDVMEEYNEFFRFTPHAYLVSYILYMAGVFDKTKKTISIVHLFREMKVGGKLSSNDCAEIDVLILKSAPLVKKVNILRNNAIAHHSAHISYNDVFKLADVRPNQLRDLTEMALEAINHLLLASGMQRQFFRDLPRHAAESMMAALIRCRSAN